MRGWQVALAAAAFGLAGCKSDPYCLNCGDQGAVDGFPVLLDLTAVDMAEPLDLMTPPDMIVVTGDGGPCVPTNSGVEICDKLDNDCNGVTDDVPQSKLVGDPNNCGMCGKVCDFTAQHQFGACVGGFDGGTPMCAPSGCVPGYVQLPGHTSCDYFCTPSNGGVEVCDGKDNNCNGQIDEPFTTTYDSSGNPHYDKDPNNCGQCAGVCQLPGAVNQCTLDGATMKGKCSVKSCINNPGVDTFTHLAGNINMTGCEYHCPFASSTAGDCFASPGSCTFPPETCNGIDDNCNGVTDDNPTDVGGPCGSCPGGVCKGVCKLGGLACVNGVKQCSNPAPVGPSIETCDMQDNDCNGFIDDGFTAAAPGGYADGNAGQMPLYNSDKNHCGSCMGANHVCALAHATNGCHSASAGAVGTCFVLSCNSGFNYADKAQCGGGVTARDGAGGLGCYYACPVNPPSVEVCDGKDNDCDGCTDEALTLPNPATFCANVGVCAIGNKVTVSCAGMSGIKCDYSMVANADFDPVTHALKPTETKCDNLDNNCNGITDTDGFPNKGNSCSTGVGVCKGNGTFVCNGPGTATTCNAVAVPANAVDELCNGKDDNCDGQTDERTPNMPGTCTNGGNHVCKGYTDPMVQAGAVWVAAYEASRPDATAASPGALSNGRACANAGVLPWATVTETQALAACTAIKNSANMPMRLCTAPEWQNACEAGTAAANKYSYATNPTVYAVNTCNDLNHTGGPAVWTTGSGASCYADWTGTNRLYDMSGNLMEWTSTTVTSGGVTYNKVRGGGFNSPADGTAPDGISCEFDFVIAKPTFANSDVGFRCCSDAAP